MKKNKTYKVYKNQEWIDVTSPEQIKKGDSFRVFDKDGKIINDTSIFRNVFMAETNAKKDLKGNIVVDACSNWGDIIVDDEINAHRICKKCGNVQKLTSRAMDTIDDLTLEELDKMIINIPQEEKHVRPIPELPENPKCDKCGGELFVVQPIIEMDGRKLLECKDCHERIYLFVDILE